ncbi:hypothetical protein ACF0H5_005114 [Mactra antiquata]
MQGFLARLKAVNKQPEETQELNGENTDGVTNNEVKEKHLRVPNGLPVEEILISDTGSRADDSLAIDIVMETNKVQKNLLSPSSPTPRPLSKTSKKHSSRTSLNSTAFSERDDIETINLDSDEELPKAEEYSPSQAWAAFENCVKNIDNSNPEYFVKKPKPNFVSSGTFQQVMVDMYGNTEYGNTKGYTILKQKLNNMGRSLKLASRMMQSAVNQGADERNKEPEESEADVEDQTEEVQAEPESTSKVLAKRGWKLLKRDINENTMEQKTNNKKLNWTILQHTVKQMSNTEKTRQDLYERYGILPRKMEDGTVVCENIMLSERARAQLNGSDSNNKRPHSSFRPSASHYRARAHTSIGFQSTRVDSAKSSKSNKSSKSLHLPNLKHSRARPITSK